jgi:hypothetical protein
VKNYILICINAVKNCIYTHSKYCVCWTRLIQLYSAKL